MPYRHTPVFRDWPCKQVVYLPFYPQCWASFCLCHLVLLVWNSWIFHHLYHWLFCQSYIQWVSQKYHFGLCYAVEPWYTNLLSPSLYRGSTVLLILNNIVSPAQSEVIMKSQVFSGCLTFNLSPNWTHLQSGKADVFPAVTSDDQKYVCLHKLHSPRQ